MRAVLFGVFGINTKIADTLPGNDDGNRINLRPTDEKVAGTGRGTHLDPLTRDDQGGLSHKEGTHELPERPGEQNNREG